MDDSEIISLYFSRSESAVEETRKKYGDMLSGIAMNILHDRSDAEECENDTYLALWSEIPPKEPENLRAYSAKVMRNLALKKYNFRNAGKRRADSAVPFDELSACIEDKSARSFTDGELREAINSFLEKLRPEARKVFLLRYWYFSSVAEISEKCGISRSKTESMLHRTRNKLRAHLKERGYFYEQE